SKMAPIENVSDGWSRWQIALAVGAPVCLGLAGLWLMRRRSQRASEVKNKAVEDVENSAKPKPEVAEKEPLEKAQSHKNKGNKYFKGGKYDQAIDCYTKAIEVCPDINKQEISTFYQNRAAAYEQLKSFSSVVEDCTKAIELNNRYIKALFRRAKANEHIGNLSTCLEDCTAVCILESFQNQTSLVMADRVLKQLGRVKAKEAYNSREPVLPAKHFIRIYFSAFANDPIISMLNKDKNKAHNTSTEDIVIEGPSDDSEPEKDRDETPEKLQGNTPFDEVKRCLGKEEYSNIIRLCTEEYQASQNPEALLVKATFHLLQGQGHTAIADFDKLLEMDNLDKRIKSNALIKRGSLKLQQTKEAEAIEDFKKAVEVDPENSDIYHHRGQLNLLLDKMDDAVKDFEHACELSPGFAVAEAQRIYTKYRNAMRTMMAPTSIQEVMAQFEKLLERFPECSEIYTLYGQTLSEQQNFEKADDLFVRALKVDPENANCFVHRGLLLLQWKQDIEGAAKLIEQALKVDDKCEFAYETLGTLEVQRGHLDRAIELFNKAIRLSKTEIEMAHLFSLLEAAVAQHSVAEKLNVKLPEGMV
ncbi:unnamed protein product, partial [Owenia fusiformis]